MGILLAFAVGWFVGARGGQRGFDDVVEAAQAVRDSEEFQALLEAGKSHVGYALKEIAAQLTGEESDELPTVDDVLSRVRAMMGRGGPTESAS